MNRSEATTANWAKPEWRQRQIDAHKGRCSTAQALGLEQGRATQTERRAAKHAAWSGVCICGCGSATTYKCQFVHGHNRQGAQQSEKQRAMMRERGAEFGAKADSSNLQSGRAAYWSQNPRPVTVLENILCDVILADFPDCQREVPFGVYTVDAYIPSLHVAFEADGYWHTRHAARDVARDVWLLRKFDLPVIRLTERDLMEAIA